MRRICRRSLAALVAAVGVIYLAGCPATDAVEGPAATETSATADEEVALADTADDEPYSPPTDYWDVLYIQGAKVGHNHTVIRPGELRGESVIVTRQDGELTIVRFGQKTTQEMDMLTAETPDGELRSFYSGPVPATLRAQVHDRSLEATITTAGKETTKTKEWDPAWRGPFAAEQSLRRQPMKPGEKRSMEALMPMSTDVLVGKLTLEADDYETVKLLDGEQKLLKVHVSHKSGHPTDMEFTAWVDRHGEVLKQQIPAMSLEVFRATRAVALDEKDAGGFDIGEFSTVKLRKPLANAAGTQRVVYNVTLQGSDPAKVFPSSGSQQVKSLGKDRAQITVVAVRPDSPAKLAVKPTPPTAGDRGSNNLIQSDDAAVVKMARVVAPDERDPWALAQALEQAVFTEMKAKNFSQAFDTAAEVARTREGDCTEHAVLLAAMCRARKIPARVAIGLVYYPPMKGMAFHMWNEVWVADRWVPLDATQGLGGVGGDRLKIADTNLADADGLSTFLPVAKVMGRLSIDVAEAE